MTDCVLSLPVSDTYFSMIVSLEKRHQLGVAIFHQPLIRLKPLHCDGIGVRLVTGPTAFFAERDMRTRREVLAATAAALVVPRGGFAQGEPPKPNSL